MNALQTTAISALLTNGTPLLAALIWAIVVNKVRGFQPFLTDSPLPN